jgi:hypothetical protein
MERGMAGRFRPGEMVGVGLPGALGSGEREIGTVKGEGKSKYERRRR